MCHSFATSLALSSAAYMYQIQSGMSYKCGKHILYITIMDCRGNRKGVIASMLQSTLGTGKFSQPAAQCSAGWLVGHGVLFKSGGSGTGRRAGVVSVNGLAGRPAAPPTRSSRLHPSTVKAKQINLIIMIDGHAMLY